MTYFLLVALTPAIAALLLRSVHLHGAEAAREDRYTPFLVVVSLVVDVLVLLGDASLLKAFLLGVAALQTVLLLLFAVAATMKPESSSEHP
jgi:hypothetical protein